MPTFRSYSSFIITISTLSPLTFTLPSPNSKPMTLHPRKEVSHNLWCADTPVPAPHRWPPNPPAPPSTYARLEELCGFDRKRPNVGCLCDSPYVQVECRRELAHPLLYAEFLPACADGCYCDHARIDALDTSVAARIDALDTSVVAAYASGHGAVPLWVVAMSDAGQAAQRATGGGSGRPHSD